VSAAPSGPRPHPAAPPSSGKRIFRTCDPDPGTLGALWATRAQPALGVWGAWPPRPAQLTSTTNVPRAVCPWYVTVAVIVAGPAATARSAGPRALTTPGRSLE